MSPVSIDFSIGCRDGPSFGKNWIGLTNTGEGYRRRNPLGRSPGRPSRLSKARSMDGRPWGFIVNPAYVDKQMCSGTPFRSSRLLCPNVPAHPGGPKAAEANRPGPGRPSDRSSRAFESG